MFPGIFHRPNPLRSALRAGLAGGAFIAFAALAAAQSQAGIIGTRHVAVSVFLEDIDEDWIDNGLGGAVRLNVPLHRVIDLAISATHERIDTNDFRESTAFATLVAHWDAHDLTPYVAGSIGLVEQSAVVEGRKFTDDETVYALGVGIEAPIGDRTALDAHATFHRYGSADLDDYWIYGLSLRHWFYDWFGTDLTVNLRESDSIVYSLGAVVRF